MTLSIHPIASSPVYVVGPFAAQGGTPGPAYAVQGAVADEATAKQDPRPSVYTSGFKHPLAVAPADRQKARYEKLLHTTHKALPQVRAEAKRWAEDMIFKLTGRTVDADSLFLNRFRQAQSANTATGWEHLMEEPLLSQALPDALLSNFNEHDQLPGVLDQQAGLYQVGAGQSTKHGYGAHNQFPLAPSRLMHESWKTDFQTRITRQQDAFWKDHGEHYRTTLKGEFVYQARQQLKAYTQASLAERERLPAEQRFTRNDYRLVMGAASNLPLDENQALTIKQLRTAAPVKGVVLTHAFDINGFPSNDILRFTADDGTHPQLRDRRDGVQILYVPGNRPAFLRFDSLTQMDQWVAEQGRDADKRKALESHFSLRDRQDNDVGFWSDFKSFVTGDHQSNKGVDTAVQHLGTGYWDNIEGTVIDSANVRIHGDVFSVMKDATRQRMASDADVVIKSSSEVTRDTWLNDVTAAAGLAAKCALIGEPFVVAVAAATGIAEAALGSEKAISGDTQAERTQGTGAALDGALNTLFSIAGGTVKEPTGELTDLESMESAKPLEGFEAYCPAPTTGGRPRRGGNDECFVKLIAELPALEAKLQALAHVRLFPSKRGLFKQDRTVIYQKRLHTVVETDTGPQLVPAAAGQRITYKQKVRGKIIADPAFGLCSGDSPQALAKDTRVVELNRVSNASDDRRQLRAVVVHSGPQQYLVVQADTDEFYYAPLGKTEAGGITFHQCGPFQQSLVYGYRQFLGANHSVQGLDAELVALPPVKTPLPRLPVKPQATVHVAMGESITLAKGNETLATRSLTDCSALAVLTDWNGTTYQSRTLMHLTGGNLEFGLRDGNTHTLLDSLQASLAKGGRVMLVGGVNSQSVQGMATVIGQEFRGQQPLRALLKERPGVTVTLAGSLGVTVKADGTFELIEGTGKGVFSPQAKRQIFERID